MKRYIYFICIITVMLTLASCKTQLQQPITDPLTDPITEPVTNPVTDPVTEPITEPVTEPVPQPVVYELTEPFLSVLKNERSFYCGGKEKLVLDVCPDLNGYALVDMSGDGKPEMAVRSTDGTVLVLIEEDSGLQGFLFGIRAMYQINTDGTFNWDSNTDRLTYGCSRLVFSNGSYEITELWRVEQNEDGTQRYFINSQSVTKDAFETLTAKQSTQTVDWMTDEIVSPKYPKTEVEISEDDVYAPIVLDGATPFALGVELPTEGCFVHAWQNEYYEGPAMKYDMGVHFVSSKLANRMPNDPSVWGESTLILSEHLQYKLVLIYAAGMRILSITYPDGTEVQEHVGYNWYTVTPIDKVGNTIRFIFGCDTKLPPGSTDYLDRYTIYEITLSDDGKSVIKTEKYSCPGEVITFSENCGVAQKLIYRDSGLDLEFYSYYTTADGGKTWTEYLPNVEDVEPIRVERLLPVPK